MLGNNLLTVYANLVSLSFCSYSHFHTKSSLGCVLFTEEDYLPPKEADDVDIPETDLEELLEPPCPQCATVSYLAFHGLVQCVISVSYHIAVTETRKEIRYE